MKNKYRYKLEISALGKGGAATYPKVVARWEPGTIDSETINLVFGPGLFPPRVITSWPSDDEANDFNSLPEDEARRLWRMAEEAYVALMCRLVEDLGGRVVWSSTPRECFRYFKKDFVERMKK